MSEILLLVGTACIVGAVIGRALRILSVEIPLLSLLVGQVLLAAAGFALVFGGLVVGDNAFASANPQARQNAATGPTPLATSTVQVGRAGETRLTATPQFGPVGTSVI